MSTTKGYKSNDVFLRRQEEVEMEKKWVFSIILVIGALGLSRVAVAEPVYFENWETSIGGWTADEGSVERL